MQPPNVSIVQGWPAVMGADVASSYLDVSRAQFLKLVKMYPDRLRTYNLIPNGDVKWSRETLDAFRVWREAIGVEKRRG